MSDNTAETPTTENKKTGQDPCPEEPVMVTPVAAEIDRLKILEEKLSVLETRKQRNEKYRELKSKQMKEYHARRRQMSEDLKRLREENEELKKRIEGTKEPTPRNDGTSGQAQQSVLTDPGAMAAATNAHQQPLPPGGPSQAPVYGQMRTPYPLNQNPYYRGSNHFPAQQLFPRQF